MGELVSVIVPAYQEEKRIERCLQSIVASSYCNLELIVVNDGSTDNTEGVIKDFKKKNESKSISINVVTTSNGGAARARNQGLHLAKGDYIGFADADDIIHPQMIEKLVTSMRKGNDLSICGSLFCNEHGKPKVRQNKIRGQRKQCPRQALATVMWEQTQMSLCTMLFRRKVIFDMGEKPALLCPEDVVAFEDFIFICEYISRCNGFMEFLPFYGYFYCKHNGSSTSKEHNIKELCYALQSILDIGERIDDTGFTAHKIQYAFLIMEFWYKEALKRNRGDFNSNCENWKIYMREIERYATVYMKAPNVTLYKKMAMWIVRNYPEVGRLLAKTAGRLVF